MRFSPFQDGANLAARVTLILCAGVRHCLFCFVCGNVTRLPFTPHKFRLRCHVSSIARMSYCSCWVLQKHDMARIVGSARFSQSVRFSAFGCLCVFVCVRAHSHVWCRRAVICCCVITNCVGIGGLCLTAGGRSGSKPFVDDVMGVVLAILFASTSIMFLSGGFFGFGAYTCPGQWYVSGDGGKYSVLGRKAIHLLI